MSYLMPEDIERFKRLTGIKDLVLNSDAARFHIPEDGSNLHKVPVKEAQSNGESPPILSPHTSQRKRHIDGTERSNGQSVCDVTPLNSRPFAGSPMFYDTRLVECFGPALIFLPPYPTKQEGAEITVATKTGFALTGSAAMGKVGPVMGLLDFGDCEDSYLFRVALPGVKRDESEFSCEVDPAGKVMVRGVTTTGEKSVYKYSQVFEMQSQNLCPPGHFSISFQLPGPIDPQQFSGNSGTDVNWNSQGSCDEKENALVEM